MAVPQNARAAPRGTAKGDDVESIRTRTTRSELPSLSHLLELAHAVGSQAERTSAEAERDRKADDAAVQALIESGLLKVLQPARFGGYESGFRGFVRICQTLARYDVSLSWVYGIIGIHHWWAPSSSRSSRRSYGAKIRIASSSIPSLRRAAPSWRTEVFG